MYTTYVNVSFDKPHILPVSVLWFFLIYSMNFRVSISTTTLLRMMTKQSVQLSQTPGGCDILWFVRISPGNTNNCRGLRMLSVLLVIPHEILFYSFKVFRKFVWCQSTVGPKSSCTVVLCLPFLGTASQSSFKLSILSIQQSANFT